MPGECDRCLEELAIGAAAAPDLIFAFADDPAAEQRHMVAACLQALRQPVHEQLGPTRVRVREIAPGDKDDLPAVTFADAATRCALVRWTRPPRWCDPGLRLSSPSCQDLEQYCPDISRSSRARGLA